MKAKLILIAIKFLMGAIALGIGIWYLSHSLGGAALTYTSMSNFLIAAGVENGDIGSANGCFLCGYVAELFTVIGNAAEMFWNAILDNIWILLVLGFGIYLFIYTIQYILDNAKKTAELDTSEKGIDFKAWFNPVLRQAIRVMLVGAALGALGMGGTVALRALMDIIITPVMFIGTELGMAATGVSDAATCYIGATASGDVLNPILAPFMCIMGNLNSVMLAGAAGGFALMNYAWLGLGGGAITWIAGLGLVIMFLIIGFNLFFEVLSVIFKLIFLIIFLPLLVAAYAFDGTWALATGVVKNAITMLVKCAISIIGVTLKILIIYATVSFVADEFYPSPIDGYTAILPPMMGMHPENPDAQTLSVINVFSTCESVSLSDGKMDADKFRDCFNTQREIVERQYPHAFDFMSNGWDFIVMMLFMFLLYFYVVSPKVDALLGKTSKEQFDIGGNIKTLGKKIWSVPEQIASAISKARSK